MSAVPCDPFLSSSCRKRPRSSKSCCRRTGYARHITTNSLVKCLRRRSLVSLSWASRDLERTVAKLKPRVAFTFSDLFLMNPEFGKRILLGFDCTGESLAFGTCYMDAKKVIDDITVDGKSPTLGDCYFIEFWGFNACQPLKISDLRDVALVYGKGGLDALVDQSHPKLPIGILIWEDLAVTVKTRSRRSYVQKDVCFSPLKSSNKGGIVQGFHLRLTISRDVSDPLDSIVIHRMRKGSYYVAVQEESHSILFLECCLNSYSFDETMDSRTNRYWKLAGLICKVFVIKFYILEGHEEDIRGKGLSLTSRG